MRRLESLFAPALLIATLAACTGQTPQTSEVPFETAGTSAGPSPATAPTTSPPPPASPMPSAEAPPSPSFGVGTSLADLLPDFAGSHFLDEQPTTLAQVIADGDQFAIGRLLSNLGLDADELEFASRSESEIALLAFRAAGLSGAALADAYVSAAMDLLPRPSLTDVEIDDSLMLRRVQIQKDDLVATLTVLPLGDAIVVGIVEPDQHDLVERTLRRILHPGPERFLPTELDGRPLQVVAIPAEAFPASGDACSLVCPGELQALAAELGVDPAGVGFAYGLLQGPPSIVVLAFEFPGVATEDLLAIREKLSDFQPGWQRTTHNVSGKTAVRYQDSLGDEPYREHWAYANDGVLYVLHVEPDGDAISPIIEETFAALP